MPIYIRLEDVKIRLIGKVQFTENEFEQNRFPDALAKRLINEAEGDVEMDLSPRYFAPFQTEDGKPFSSLPPRPTQEYIRTLCELKAVSRILETAFGSGGVVNPETYKKSIDDRYAEMIKRTLDKLSNSKWVYPPFPKIKLNYFNESADDGYVGTVINTHNSTGTDYPAKVSNNPALGYYHGGYNNYYNYGCDYNDY